MTAVFDVETACPEWAGPRRPGLHLLGTRRIELDTAPAPDDPPDDHELYVPAPRTATRQEEL
jgi:hypothetical protein